MNRETYPPQVFGSVKCQVDCLTALHFTLNHRHVCVGHVLLQMRKTPGRNNFSPARPAEARVGQERKSLCGLSQLLGMKNEEEEGKRGKRRS